MLPTTLSPNLSEEPCRYLSNYDPSTRSFSPDLLVRYRYLLYSIQSVIQQNATSLRNNTPKPSKPPPTSNLYQHFNVTTTLITLTTRKLDTKVRTTITKMRPILKNLDYKVDEAY